MRWTHPPSTYLSSLNRLLRCGRSGDGCATGNEEALPILRFFAQTVQSEVALGHSAVRPPLPYPHCLDAVLPHGLDPDRVPVGRDRVAAPRQAAEGSEDIAAHRVVGIRV